MMQYTNRIIKPSTVKFESFKETEDTQEMVYPLTDIDASHELWQQTNARVNAAAYKERLALEASTKPVVKEVPAYDFSDIDEFYQGGGRGSKLLEFEFDPVTPDPKSYTNKSGKAALFWVWTHRLTGKTVKRFQSATGNTFDTGRLTKFLKCLKESASPLSHARAQHILRLNGSLRKQAGGAIESPIAHDRVTLVRQQVCVTVYLFLYRH